MTSLPQPPRPRRSKTEEDVAKPAEALLRFVEQLSDLVVRPGDPLRLDRRPGRGIILWPGDHGSLVFDRDGLHVLFMPGAYAGKVRVTRDCVISGLDVKRLGVTSFTGALLSVEASARLSVHGGKLWSDVDKNPLVSVAAAAGLVLSGVRLHKEGAGTFVEVANGGKFIGSGVNFGPPTAVAAPIVNNAGLAANAALTSNNDTGAGHVNVTVLFES